MLKYLAANITEKGAIASTKSIQSSSRYIPKIQADRIFSSSWPAVKSEHEGKDAEIAKREESSVLIVGFPDGTPKGLRIYNNKSPERMDLGQYFQSHKEENDPRIGKYDSKLGKMNHLRSFKGRVSPTSSGTLHNSEVKSRRRYLKEGTGSPKMKKRKLASNAVPQVSSTGSSSVEIVAPWRQYGMFLSPEQRRKQTFNTFKMMSFDPPNALINTMPKSILQTSHQIHNDYYNEVLRVTNFGSKSSWDKSKPSSSPRNELNSELRDKIKSRQKSRETSQGKSFTGLSLNDSRLSNRTTVGNSNRVLQTHSGRGSLKPVALNPEHDTQSVTTVLPRKRSTPSIKSVSMFSHMLPNLASRWPHLQSPVPGIETNQSPTAKNPVRGQPPAGRGPSSGSNRNHEAESRQNEASPKAEIRPKVAGLAVPLAQGLNSPRLIPESRLDSDEKTETTQQKKGVTPGWKRENIYIGVYDGSDPETESEESISAESLASRKNL